MDWFDLLSSQQQKLIERLSEMKDGPPLQLQKVFEPDVTAINDSDGCERDVTCNALESLQL
jgi:hypothetical protein